MEAVDLDTLFLIADEARRQTSVEEGEDDVDEMDEEDDAFKAMFANASGRLRRGKPTYTDMPDGDVHVCYGTQCPHAEVTKEKQIGCTLTGRVVGGMFLSDDEISAFREVFSLVDKDGSGEIDAEEVSELMELLGMSADKSTVETMIKEIDADGNGNVDFDEFLVVMAGGQSDGSFTKRDIMRAFREFADKSLPSGFISPTTLEESIVKYSREPVTAQRAQSLVAALRRDPSGNIDYLEKIQALMN